MRRMALAPDDVTFVTSERNHGQNHDEDKDLQRIEESGHDERDEQQSVHHQQRKPTIVTDEIIPVPTKECDHRGPPLIPSGVRRCQVEAAGCVRLRLADSDAPANVNDDSVCAGATRASISALYGRADAIASAA